MMSSKAMKRTIFSFFIPLLVTLGYLLCTLGMAAYWNAMQPDDASGLLRFLCAILSLLYYPLSILIGAGAAFLAGLPTRRQLRWSWFSLAGMGAAAFCYGHLLSTQNAALLTPPPFFSAAHALFSKTYDFSGSYFLVYGASLILAAVYTPQQISRVFLLLKVLLSAGLVLVVHVLLCDYAANAKDSGFFHVLAWPAMLAFIVVCGAAGFILPLFSAYNVRGRMRPWFWLLFLLGGITAASGLFLVVGTLFLSDLPYHLLRDLPFIPYDVAKMFREISGFFIGLGLAAHGIACLVGTFIVHSMQCPSCHMYAHETHKDLGSEFVGESDDYTESESDLISSRFHSSGWQSDHYHDYDRTYRDVTSRSHYSVHCRYCGYFCGTESYTTVSKELRGSKRTGSHTEWH